MTDRTIKQSPTKSIEYGYNALWKAVILQAVADYRKHPEMRSEVARFFRSNYFKMITEVDGERIVTLLQTELKSKAH